MTVLSWLNSSNFGMWAGILIGVVGLAINIYYKRKHDRRAAEAHKVYMAQHAHLLNSPSLPPNEADPDSEFEHPTTPKKVA